MDGEVKRCTVCGVQAHKIRYSIKEPPEYLGADNGQIVCDGYCQRKLNQRIKEMSHEETHLEAAKTLAEQALNGEQQQKFQDLCNQINNHTVDDVRKNLANAAAQGIPLIITASNKPSDISDTLKERGSRYGKFPEQAKITQGLKSAMKDSPNWYMLAEDQKEALEMVQHKIARILNGDPDFVDSWFDIEGYVKLVRVRIETGEKV